MTSTPSSQITPAQREALHALGLTNEDILYIPPEEVPAIIRNVPPERGQELLNGGNADRSKPAPGFDLFNPPAAEAMADNGEPEAAPPTDRPNPPPDELPASNPANDRFKDSEGLEPEGEYEKLGEGIRSGVDRDKWNALVDQAHACDMVTVARAHGAKLRKSGVELIGGCPVCGTGDDRFAINLRKHLFNCRGCGKGGGGPIDLEMFLSGCEFVEAVRRLTNTPSRSTVTNQNPAQRERENEQYEAKQHQKAGQMWERRQPATDSPVETYLRARGYDGTIPPTIGYLPARGQHPHAMISAFPLPNEIKPGELDAPLVVRSVHITKLLPDGSDRIHEKRATPKYIVGRPLSLPIAISSLADKSSLAITEGPEDAFAYRAAGLAAWAAGSASHIPALADNIPDHITTLIVEHHLDPAAERAAADLQALLNERPIEIIVREAVGKDGNKEDAADILQKQGAQALRTRINDAIKNSAISSPGSQAQKTNKITATPRPEPTINWAKVRQPGWLKSAADLPNDVPPKLKIIIGHAGKLDDLNNDLIEAGHLTKPYGSWAGVTLALTALLKSYGRYTTEEIAEALLADLPCNQYVASQKNKKRTIERAITRSAKTLLFRDCDKYGTPKPSLANAVIAIHALGIMVRYDLFHNRIKVTYNGESKTIHEGLLTDNTISAIRSLINNTYRLDCGDPNTLAAIREIAWNNAYDPVLDMLNQCQSKWDGKTRLDTWVIVYLDCEDTPLNRAIGRLALIAACRRARKPGCKFDNIIVLEDELEGTNKSTAIKVLAGDDENFSDQSILGASDKEIQEQLDGIWIHENADLAGMTRAEVDKVKAFASRQFDRARPAFGHVREDRPRRSTEWGSTNKEEYLLSQTGNRRFWLLKTGKINLEALKRDRNQLIGEAATYEAANETITLAESLWPAARDAQEQRRVKDPWEDILENIPVRVDISKDQTTDFVTIIHTSGDGHERVERVASADLLAYVLNVPKAQQSSFHSQRLAQAMKRAGWTRNPSGRVTINSVPVRGYIRGGKNINEGEPPFE